MKRCTSRLTYLIVIGLMCAWVIWGEISYLFRRQLTFQFFLIASLVRPGHVRPRLQRLPPLPACSQFDGSFRLVSPLLARHRAPLQSETLIAVSPEAEAAPTTALDYCHVTRWSRDRNPRFSHYGKKRLGVNGKKCFII